MHYSMKKAEKAVQTARQTARDTTIAVKKTAKAITHAIKALIEATKALLSALTAGGWIAVMILIIVILFGGFLCMTGGDNSSTVSSVSAEVEAYEPLIRQYANQYGIGEYVELIKAIMMQESGGRGLDPMQCSEGSFNTKYPKQPNGITDPEYSISCGVQEIKSCLERAGVKNPLDMENIKLALQSYNYGNGYLEWAKARGGYTLANAAEFSDMMAQRMGWSSYGDKQYVPHVLQYYAFGRIPTGIGNQAIVQVAASQEGKGGTTYWSGAPALCPGVQTRAVISKVESFRNSLFVRTVSGGLKVKVGSVTEVIPRWQEILFSLTGEIMERLTMLEL